MACFLFSALEEFVFKTDLYDNSLIGMIGFLIMITAQLIQDILNEKYFTKYSKKVKKGIIICIVTITIGAPIVIVTIHIIIPFLTFLEYFVKYFSLRISWINWAVIIIKNPIIPINELS